MERVGRVGARASAPLRGLSEEEMDSKNFTAKIPSRLRPFLMHLAISTAPHYVSVYAAFKSAKGCFPLAPRATFP